MKLITDTHGYYIPVSKKNTIPWIHEIKNAKYLALNKTWFIPAGIENRNVLASKNLVEQILVPERKAIPENLMEKLPKSLYDIQKEAIEFIYSRNGSALVAYDMGLGKTAIALSYAHMMEYKTVIICQATLKKQWASQIEQWVGHNDYHIIYGRTSYELPDAQYYIVNYEILEEHTPMLKQCNQIILDECQFIASTRAERTKVFMDFSMKIGRVIALSGTPITRRPIQFYPILHVLMPVEITDYYHFGKRYCGLKRGRYGWDVSGATNIEELHMYLEKVMIRKTKKDSMDIPAKRFIPILMEMDSCALEEYSTEEQKTVENVFGKGDYQKNKRAMVYLQYLAYMGKRKSVIEWIKEFLLSGEKLMVFCIHRHIVEDLQKEIGGVIYYGGMSDKSREEAKKAFTEKENLLIGNIATMGTGLDGLQHVCHNTVFVELPFTPTTFDQATDRLWRIGQNNDVNVYTLIADKTIENHIIKILDKSRKIVHNVLNDDGEATTLKEIIKEIRK